MVDLASYNALAGDREFAIELVQKALEMVDAERDPRTVLAARHNLAVFLQESGRLREALAVLAQARSLYETLGDRRNLLRLRWLEGSLAEDVGEIALAEEAFLEVYHGFVDETPLAAAQVGSRAGAALPRDRPRRRGRADRDRHREGVPGARRSTSTR